VRTLYHPNMRDTSLDVADDAVAAYTAQGWRKTPKNFDAAPADSTTTSTRSSASGEDNTKEVNE